MTPSTAYSRLNKLLWRNRLPKAKLVFVDDSIMPRCYGLTVDEDEDFTAPLIFLNAKGRYRSRTLIHEMLHLAEPELPHGTIFTALVNSYYRFAHKHIKGLGRI